MVAFLGCIFDEALSGESMAIHAINKINSRLTFLYCQNRYLNFPLRRLLWSAMIQSFFDYACTAWCPSINKKLKKRLQAAQNKCIRFCLKLIDRSSIKSKDFEKIKWLPIHERISQCSLCSIYNCLAKNCPNYFDETYVLFKTIGIHTSSSNQKLNVPHRKTNVGQKGLSYVGHSLWNNLNKTLKNPSSLNIFKRNIKKHYFNKLKKKES